MQSAYKPIGMRIELEWVSPTVVFNGFLADYRMVDTRPRDQYMLDHIHESESHPLEGEDLEEDYDYHDQLDTVVFIPASHASASILARLAEGPEAPSLHPCPEADLLHRVATHAGGRLRCIRILLGGFEAFKADYPFFCTGTPGYVPAYRPFPQHLEGHRVFIGPESSASDVSILRDLGITHVVNVTPQAPPVLEGPFRPEYLCIAVEDDSSQAEYLGGFFETAIRFITHALKNEHARVLVHCQRGHSRSATIVLAYLMSIGLRLEAALALLKRARPTVRPNDGFLACLERLDRQLITQGQ